jgi:hypothetical protein
VEEPSDAASGAERLWRHYEKPGQQTQFPADRVPMRRYQWDRLVLRLELAIELKAIAPALSQFGDADGSDVAPGYALLGYAFNLSERTIQDYVGILLMQKLLWVARRGGGRGHSGRRTVFQLTAPADGNLPYRLDVDLNPLYPRAPGRAPVRAIEASRRARLTRSATLPVKAAIDQKRNASGEKQIDRNPASGGFPIDRKPNPDSPEAQPRLTGSPASDSVLTNLTKPLSLVSLGGDLTSGHRQDPAAAPPAEHPGADDAPPTAGLSLTARYAAALEVMADFDEDAADMLYAAARRELRAQGVEPNLRPLTIRAAAIATRPDPGASGDEPDQPSNDNQGL